ncbi:exonuclease III [Desulfosporosinus orientis DSM 765]|uniref:Exonuclease III n=1 Tax=Desulfosporosinus orientis (strain ATCC 19365 / DSM 765 / NCIMB 8382 / VKM B-1628 / Singapore I) TaxID=768706 RepID=G7WJD0_DESOD|nr:endonuclease/exonuclease/phosphatase family protein [Desulfosporosinus orientis]AET69789.1 exonuclease III [Desulfosporosinus orientis DSM 765]
MACTIASINVNKRLRNSVHRANFENWLVQLNPELVLLQEPWSYKQKGHVEIRGYRFIDGNSNVAVYCLETYDWKEIAQSLKYNEERWLSMQIGNITIHNLYFPSDKSPQKKELLNHLTEKLYEYRDKSHILVGDFNFAPGEEDGLFDGQISSWTSTQERNAFQRLVTTINLVDMHPQEDIFTFERQINNKLSQFRCDLALISSNALGLIKPSVTYSHVTRRGEYSFTDHSGVICHLLG